MYIKPISVCMFVHSKHLACIRKH